MSSGNSTMSLESPPAMIGPSVLASDLASLASDSQRVLDLGADYLHLDIMDGNFVPNISFGPPVVKCLRKHVPKAFLDCHLMVAKPEQWVDDVADAGADRYTFHIEATDDVKGMIERIHKRGMKAGVAIKPKTAVEDVFPFVDDLDMVLIMTVEPGFGGQKFMQDMMPKVEALRKRCPGLDIQVDGGLSPKTIDAAAKAGANIIVAGSSVFKADDPKYAMDAMRNSIIEHARLAQK